MKITVSLAVLICLATALPAQNTDAPTFSAGTTLIQISVVAASRGGPVLDLTKSDFRIRDNKRDQPISLFISPFASPAVNTDAEGLSSQGNLNTQAAPRSTSDSGSAAIVLDWLNSGFADKVYMRQKTLVMLGAIRLADRVALFTNGRTLGVLHDFTSNNSSLLESLTGLRANVDAPYGDEVFGTPDLAKMAGIDDRIRADATKRNVGPVIELLRRQPGKKSLIWVSSRFSGIPIGDLIRANITLYLVDARGLQIAPLLPGNLGKDAQQAWERATLSMQGGVTYKAMAERTGGTYYGDRNDLDGAMREALDETRTSYAVGFYLPSGAEPGQHEIQIDVKRRGVTLRYRTFYLVGPKPEYCSDIDRRRALECL